jgi:hypothetical protein
VIVATPSAVLRMIESVAINEAGGCLWGWFGRSIKHSA